MKRCISIYQVLDNNKFLDVTNKYRLDLSNTDGTLEIKSAEPLFDTVLSTFQTDNYFTVVIRYQGTKVCVSVDKVNDLCKYEVFSCENNSQHAIRLTIHEVPKIPIR